MMDRDEMAKMKKGGMGDEKMKCNMPVEAPMPIPGTDIEGAEGARPGSPSSDLMKRMRAPMKGKPGMSSMAPASQLPGFPGASHPQPVGLTGFLRDRPQHITLSIRRQTAFNRIGEKSLLNAANSMGRIDNAGQVVWMLAASDAPDGLRRVPQSTSHIIKRSPAAQVRSLPCRLTLPMPQWGRLRTGAKCCANLRRHAGTTG